MEDLFNVDEYRNYLESFFVYKYDEKTVLERKQQISRYSDEYLQKIIDDTETFIKYLVNKLMEEKHIFEGNIFTNVPIYDDNKYINNNCIGGWPADCLYHLADFENEFRVSLHLLKKYLGDARIDEDNTIIEDYDEDDDIGSFSVNSFLHISMPLEKFHEISENDNENIKQLSLVKY